MQDFRIFLRMISEISLKYRCHAYLAYLPRSPSLLKMTILGLGASSYGAGELLVQCERIIHNWARVVFMIMPLFGCSFDFFFIVACLRKRVLHQVLYFPSFGLLHSPQDAVFTHFGSMACPPQLCDSKHSFNTAHTRSSKDIGI